MNQASKYDERLFATHNEANIGDKQPSKLPTGFRKLNLESLLLVTSLQSEHVLSLKLP